MSLKRCLAIGLIAGLAGCTPVAVPSASIAVPSAPTPSAGTPSAVAPLSGSERFSPPTATSTAGSGTDVPSLAPGETIASVFAGRRSVDAGETVTQALAFESTSLAAVALFAPSGTLSARVGAIPLVATDAPRAGFSQWGLTLSSPADADLTITNTSTTAVDVDALVTVRTTRTLTVSAPSTAVVGETIIVDVSLTDAVSGDEPSAFLADESGLRTTFPLTRVGPGRWTGTIAPPHAGSYRVLATVGGDRPRSGVDLLTASSGESDSGVTP